MPTVQAHKLFAIADTKYAFWLSEFELGIYKSGHISGNFKFSIYIVYSAMQMKGEHISLICKHKHMFKNGAPTGTILYRFNDSVIV